MYLRSLDADVLFRFMQDLYLSFFLYVYAIVPADFILFAFFI
jgi:hypothetical protein